MPTSWASILIVAAVALAIAGGSLLLVGFVALCALIVDVVIDVGAMRSKR